MSQGERAAGGYQKWEMSDGMEAEEPERRKGLKAVLAILTSSLERAVGLLYVLLGLVFLIFMIISIVNVQRDKQLSGELRGMSDRLTNVSREAEKVTRSEAERGTELSDRLRALEKKDSLKPLLEQLAQLKQEQIHTSAALDAALEEMRNLSEVICTRCPAGWLQFSRTCYFFSSTVTTWLEAKDSCAKFDAHLAVVESEQENKFLANHVMDNRVFWLGLSDSEKEGEWRWLDGRPLSLPFWNKGEPNDVGQHGEDCATIFSNGFWNDVPCTNPEAWICERSC